MKLNPWHQYPCISAFVLAAAMVLLLFNGFYIFDGIPDRPPAFHKLVLKATAGGVLWILGCGLASRTRNDTWIKGLLCGLFFLPGLLILIFISGGQNRQEIWEKANPTLAGRRVRRHNRDIKPLY